MITPDQNTLLFITSSNTTANVILRKFNVSAELSKPLELGNTYLYNSGFAKNIRLSLMDGNLLLTSWGNIYDISTLTLKAKNGQASFPYLPCPNAVFMW